MGIQQRSGTTVWIWRALFVAAVDPGLLFAAQCKAAVFGQRNAELPVGDVEPLVLERELGADAVIQRRGHALRGRDACLIGRAERWFGGIGALAVRSADHYSDDYAGEPAARKSPEKRGDADRIQRGFAQGAWLHGSSLNMRSRVSGRESLSSARWPEREPARRLA